MKAQGVRYPEDLTAKAEAETVRPDKITTGQLVSFNGPLEDYLASREVEEKTAAKDRHAIEKFAAAVSTVEEANSKAVRGFVKCLANEGLKTAPSKTIFLRYGFIGSGW